MSARLELPTEPVLPAGGQRPGLLRRWHAWWLARLAPSDTLSLTQRNVYILPTAPGLMFALTLAVLLVASINYQLGLGYLLTFLLAGCGVAALYLTHATLCDLRLRLKPPAPVFAGEAAVLEVTLSNETKRARHAIALGLQPGPRQRANWTWTDVAPQAQASVHVSLRAARRGWLRLPPLQAETRFPLGIVRVWTVWQPAARVLVYPRPDPAPPPLPSDGLLPDGGAAGRRRDSGETEGVRAYRRGDPLRSVVWKKAAKTGELISRDTVTAGQRRLWLDWHALTGLPPEARLERLAAWVLMAEAAGLHYGLRLPGLEIAPQQGEVHRSECLRGLALWGSA